MKRIRFVAALALSVAFPLSASADNATYDAAVTASRTSFEAGKL